MLIVTASVTARAENIEMFAQLAVAHVRRSRAQDGCLHHMVARDCENPRRLCFVEHWRDRASLDTQMRSPEALAFATAVRREADSWEAPHIYEVSP